MLIKPNLKDEEIIACLRDAYGLNYGEYYTDSIFTDNLNLKEKALDSQENITALNPESNIELLLASQMMAVHNYQQRLISYAINTNNIDASVKYSNLAAKLANVFIQQVNLMQKLKGTSQQRIVFEHVHIHNGAQAVVGAINTNLSPIHGKP